MVKGRATSVKRIEPSRRRREEVPRTEAWLARVAAGKQARAAAALEDQAVFDPTSLRADPVELLERQGPSRVAELLPSQMFLNEQLKGEIKSGKVIVHMGSRGLVVSLQEAAFYLSGENTCDEAAFG